MAVGVSLIICTLDPLRLGRVASALMRQDLAPLGEVELLIVASGCADEEFPVAPEVGRLEGTPGWTVRRIPCPELGLARARNAGLATSRGAVIAWTDDDTEPQAEWLSRLTAPLLAPSRGAEEVHATSGCVWLADELERDWLTASHRRRLAEVRSFAGLVGANMAFRRLVLDRVPAFDEALGAGELGFQEETLFHLQLQEAGYSTRFVPEAVVVHHFSPGRLARGAWLRSAEQLGRSTAYVACHWLHSELTWVRLRLWRKQVQLGVWRWLHHPLPAEEAEGIDERELGLVQLRAFYRTLLAERHRGACYARHGLCKRTAMDGSDASDRPLSTSALIDAEAR